MTEEQHYKDCSDTTPGKSNQTKTNKLNHQNQANPPATSQKLLVQRAILAIQTKRGGATRAAPDSPGDAKPTHSVLMGRRKAGFLPMPSQLKIEPQESQQVFV